MTLVCLGCRKQTFCTHRQSLEYMQEVEKMLGSGTFKGHLAVVALMIECVHKQTDED